MPSTDLVESTAERLDPDRARVAQPGPDGILGNNGIPWDALTTTMHADRQQFKVS